MSSNFLQQTWHKMITVEFKSERAKIKDDPMVNAKRTKLASKKTGLLSPQVKDSPSSDTDAVSAKRCCRAQDLAEVSYDYYAGINESYSFEKLQVLIHDTSIALYKVVNNAT